MVNMTAPREDYINLGSLFRSSATITFVIQIVAVIMMIGSLSAYAVGDLFFAMNNELKILVLLLTSIVALLVFLAAMSVFIRFSRRIGDAVVGPGIEEVKMNTPRVKTVVVAFGLLVALMGITGVYAWYLIDLYFLTPWAVTLDSISIRIFGIALGAFFIALLIQIIVAGVGRTATRLIIEVLDADDSEFLE
ncbi:MAG: hypothetical protein AM326_07865 [Candidatus Thorarchaeota archaeon SMTZ-45]|nr:MAG: hypothetical protein AM326_07865 [Candidatus Thorarchaeota archaeon SMTZ-45]